MPDPMIPAEAVEAAAKSYWDKLSELGYRKWDEIPEDGREWRRDNMQTALEAAAPYMMGEAWKEGEAAGQDNAYAYQIGIAVKSNPYRPAGE